MGPNEDTNRHRTSRFETVMQQPSLPSTFNSIMTYARVWIGIAVTITVLELLLRYFTLQILKSIRHLFIQIVMARRQEREQTTTRPESPLGEMIGASSMIERPDVIPLFPSDNNDMDGHNLRLQDQLDTLKENQQTIRNSIMHVNMIQMISSVLMIYRCIIVNHNKSRHLDSLPDSGTFENWLDHDTIHINLTTYNNQFITDMIPNKMVSPFPYLWPTFLFGTNVSYATCLLLLYWLSLTPLLPNAMLQDQQLQQGQQSTAVSRTIAEIPFVSETDSNATDTVESSDAPKKKASYLYTVHSIMKGTFVGWLWGNSYLYVPTLATPIVSNAICIVVLVGSILSLKVRYPNAFLLSWLSNVGCNRRGQPLIYDPDHNRWINDPIYCDDTLPRNENTDDDDDDDDDDDSTGDECSEVDRNLDDVDIEAGRLDRDHCDDDNGLSYNNDENNLEITSLLNSNRSSNNVRSRRSTTVQ